MSGEKQNVVLVTIDSLRADHCGFMGYEHETTPTLDLMAEKGTYFENAIAPGPSTYDSMPAIFTGRRMVPRTVGREFEGDTLDRRTKNIELNMHGETLAEWFDRNGYATGAFTTNPYTGKHTAFARGFDRFEDFIEGGEGRLMQKAAHVPVLSELKHLVTLVQGNRASMQWPEYYRDIIEWVRGTSEPYFLWIFLLDTHTPYLVDSKFRTELGLREMYYHNWKLWMAKKWLSSEGHSLDRDSLISLYDDTIRSADAFLNRLLSDVGDTDPTVVVHADHGEAFGEHGIYGHQGTLYEENVHVPFVIYNGSRTGVERQPVSLARLPSILRTVSSQAESLRTVLNGSNPVATTTTWDGGRFAVRGRDFKYIATVDTETATIRNEEVYDLTTDSQEQQNLTSQHESVVETGRALLRRRWRHEQEVENAAARVTTLVEERLAGIDTRA